MHEPNCSRQTRRSSKESCSIGKLPSVVSSLSIVHSVHPLYFVRADSALKQMLMCEVQKGEFTIVAKTETRSDNSICDDVLFELSWDPKISSNDIAVAVKEGVVTLAGLVSSYWEKLEAEKAAKRVSGVKAVANDIEVKLTSKRTDPEIARAAVHVLENNVGYTQR